MSNQGFNLVRVSNKDYERLKAFKAKGNAALDKGNKLTMGDVVALALDALEVKTENKQNVPGSN